MIRLAFIGFVTMLTLCACDSGVLVSEKWEWENQQWITGDHKSMKMVAPDTTTVYQMDLDIVHSDTYGFQNLYVKTTTIFPSGKEVSSVTSLELINADGTWAGDCSGGHCSISLPLQHGFTFPETGTYTWSVEPYMRMDTIQGIKSLSITCRKVKE